MKGNEPIAPPLSEEERYQYEKDKAEDRLTPDEDDLSDAQGS